MRHNALEQIGVFFTKAKTLAFQPTLERRIGNMTLHLLRRNPQFAEDRSSIVIYVGCWLTT